MITDLLSQEIRIPRASSAPVRPGIETRMIINIVSAAYRKQLLERVVLGITRRYQGLPPLRTGDRCLVTAPDTYERSAQMITINN